MAKRQPNIQTRTFIVDCVVCKAKVAALEKGCAERGGVYDGDPWGERIYIGECPKCHTFIVGESFQTHFEGIDADDDIWTDIVRVHPKPPKTFSGVRMPRPVKESLIQAERSMQANANIAACAMFGRALEALCRDKLSPLKGPKQPPAIGDAPDTYRSIMLGKGIELLRSNGIIDEKLYEWSNDLKIYRNIAAHPEDMEITRQDAEDLQTFVHAIVEYVYDLTERYSEFKARTKGQIKRKAAT